MSSPAVIAKSFLDVYSAKYAARDVNGLSELYGDDSTVSFDGQSVHGRAAIAQAIAPRCASGGVAIRWATYDAQQAPGGYLIIAVTGESSVPAAKFSQLFTLFPLAGGGMYLKNDIVRFGPGAVAFNTSLDASSLGGQFAQQYYAVYGSNRAALAGAWGAGENGTHWRLLLLRGMVAWRDSFWWGGLRRGERLCLFISLREPSKSWTLFDGEHNTHIDPMRLPLATSVCPSAELVVLLGTRHTMYL